MKKVNALQLRQSLGRILRSLRKDGEPILIERRREPAAVLISLEAYQLRFVDREADEKRRALVREITEAKLTLPGSNAVEAIRELRSKGR